MPSLVGIAVSTISWSCLWAGLAIVAFVATADRVVAWQVAADRAALENTRVAEIEAEVMRLQRLTVAMKTDPLFRREWLRREWGYETSDAVEAIPVERDLMLQPRKTVDRNMPETPQVTASSWVEHLSVSQTFDRGVGGAVGVVLLSFGVLAPLLTRTRPQSTLRVIVRRLVGRYRVDARHEIGRPNLNVASDDNLKEAFEPDDEVDAEIAGHRTDLAGHEKVD